MCEMVSPFHMDSCNMRLSPAREFGSCVEREVLVFMLDGDMGDGYFGGSGYARSFSELSALRWE